MRSHLAVYIATFLFGAACFQSDETDVRTKSKTVHWPYMTVSFQPPAEGEQRQKDDKESKDSEGKAAVKKPKPDQNGKKSEEQTAEEKRQAAEKEAAAASDENTEGMPEEESPLTEKQLADVEAMRTTAEQFAIAYSKGEAAAAAAVFTETAEYVDELGNSYRGREEIQRLLAEYFEEHPSCILEIDIDSIRFVSDGVAIEDGTTVVTHYQHADGEHSTASETKKNAEVQRPEADAEKSPAQENANEASDAKEMPETIVPSELDDPETGRFGSDSDRVQSRYSAVYVNVEGKWLIASVRDFPHERRHDHRTRLSEMNWLMGQWVDEEEDALVHFSCEPTDNGHYLIRTFAIVVEGREAFSGTQRIGWCPLSHKLRTWIFDSEGGYADGFWHRDGNDWALKCSGVNADGESMSYTTLYTLVNNHTMTWQYVDLEIDGVRQDDSEVYTIVRQSPVPAPAVAHDGN